MKTIILLVVAAAAFCAAEEFASLKIEGPKMNYMQALVHCFKKNKTLLTPDHHEWHSHVYDLMKKHNATRVWIGVTRLLSDNFETKPWQWEILGRKQPQTIDHMWGPLEPNNFRRHKEYCVEMRVLPKNTEKTAWNDAPCTHLNHVICGTRQDIEPFE